MHQNSFNLLRLAFALLVIVSHGFQIVGASDPLWRLTGAVTLGDCGVYSFFILSGFLLTGSWNANPALWPFLVRRYQRIVPGFLGAVAVCLVLFGPLGMPLFYDRLNVEYLLSELLTLRFRIAGFEGNVASDMNRSMWTIHYEVACYLILAAAGVLGVLRRAWAVAVMFIALVLTYMGQVALGRVNEYVQFAAYFFAGAMLHYVRPNLSPSMLVGCVVLLVASLFDKVTAVAGMVLAWPALMYAIGSKKTKVSEWIGTTDISYGVYLYAWPVHQLIFQKVTTSLWIGLLLTVLVSCALGWISWRFIEHPAMRLKRPRLALA